MGLFHYLYSSTLPQASLAMKLFIIFVAALIATVNCQDVAGFPDNLLADINPGPDSSNPGTWYILESAGKAYTSVNITGKLFRQIAVTDGTTAGTKLINTEINMAQRGDAYAKDPFYQIDKDYPILFCSFNVFLWVSLYNYNTSNWDIYTVDPKDDILKKYTGGIVKTVDPLYGDEYLNIRKVRIFKGEYFAFSPDVIYHGLHFFDKTFTSSYMINNASQFMITPDLYDPFTGFDDSSSTFYITDNFLIIEGWVQNNGGLWAYDGTTVWPLNLASQKFHDNLKYYDAVHNKFYYIAFFNDLPQLVVNDLNNLTKNYTILTNLNQNCFPVYDCFSYLGAMDEQKGTVAFAYNAQLGFSDGSLAGTTFLTTSPRAASVLGAFNGKLYFVQYSDSLSGGYLMVTDGTKENSKVVLENYVTGQFYYFNGVVLFNAEGFRRLNKDGSITLIRDVLPTMDGEFARVTLPNNHTQLYLYYKDTRSCGRGCTRKYWYIYVTDGSGIVQFSGNFQYAQQNVFLNNRFLMEGYSDNTGNELFYMNPAPESYETPPPQPISEPSNTTSSATQAKAFKCLLVLVISLFLL